MKMLCRPSPDVSMLSTKVLHGRTPCHRITVPNIGLGAGDELGGIFSSTSERHRLKGIDLDPVPFWLHRAKTTGVIKTASA